MSRCYPRVAIAAIVWAISATVWGGATDTTAPASEQVSARAQARWAALIDGKLERAYGFLTPGYRQGVNLATYKAQLGGAVVWENAEVRKTDCTDSRCDVSVAVTYTYPKLDVSNTRVLTERWVHRDGQWWFAQE